MYIEDRLFSENNPEEVLFSVTMTESEYSLYSEFQKEFGIFQNITKNASGKLKKLGKAAEKKLISLAPPDTITKNPTKYKKNRLIEDLYLEKTKRLRSDFDQYPGELTKQSRAWLKKQTTDPRKMDAPNRAIAVNSEHPSGLYGKVTSSSFTRPFKKWLQKYKASEVTLTC